MSNPKKDNSRRPLTTEELERIAARFKVLGEAMRLRILQAVCKQARTVNDIVIETGSTQANVSKHLSLLAASGILARRREGQRVYYGVKDRLAVRLCELVRSQVPM
jgi:DNA-binding transcriptional ArsR family regulator